MPATKEAAKVNSAMRQSRKARRCGVSVASGSRGMSLGTRSNRLRTPQAPSRRPAAPPIDERRTLSVRSCRMMRQRLAPTAARTASSCWREAARASNKFATLPQAIKRTNNTAATRTRRAVLTSATTASRMGVTTMPSFFSIHFGLARRKRSAISLISARASPSWMPGLSRAATAR